MGRVEGCLFQLARFGGRNDSQHARRRLGAMCVDGDDAPLGDRRTDDVAIRRVGHFFMPLVGITCRTRGLERAIDAVGGATEYLALVERIHARGIIELHDRSSFACARTAANVRSTRVTLNSLSGVGLAPDNKVLATAFAPWGNARSAFSTRQGLWATPPSATRPVPSFCWISATETRANAYDARSRTL